MAKFKVTLHKEVIVTAKDSDEALESFIWGELDGDMSPFIKIEKFTEKDPEPRTDGCGDPFGFEDLIEAGVKLSFAQDNQEDVHNLITFLDSAVRKNLSDVEIVTLLANGYESNSLLNVTKFAEQYIYG